VLVLAGLGGVAILGWIGFGAYQLLGGGGGRGGRGGRGRR
jgi:hypothetical protein